MTKTIYFAQKEVLRTLSPLLYNREKNPQYLAYSYFCTGLYDEAAVVHEGTPIREIYSSCQNRTTTKWWSTRVDPIFLRRTSQENVRSMMAGDIIVGPYTDTMAQIDVVLPNGSKSIYAPFSSFI